MLLKCGGKDVLLSDEFLKMKAFVTAIFNSLCSTVTIDHENYRRLMSEFDFFTLKFK